MKNNKKVTFCILPLFCVPTNVLIRFDDGWWIKNTFGKLELANNNRITSYPDTRKLAAILKEDSYFLSGAHKGFIKDEIMFENNPF